MEMKYVETITLEREEITHMENVSRKYLVTKSYIWE